MTKDEIKQKIIKVCKEIDAPVPVVMALAGIESNFNSSAKSKSGSYVGIFQLSNGFGGCSGDSRLDLEKSIRCLWNNHSTYKERWSSTGDKSWNDFYYYGIHQQGFAGFREIYLNKNKMLNEISEQRRKNILANKPSGVSWSRVSDWWNYFEKKFYSIYNEYKSFSITPQFASMMPANPYIIGGILLFGFISLCFLIKN